MKLPTILLACGLLTTGAFAQRVDPNAAAVANLREDVRLLQQQVGELRFTVEQLQRDNQALATQTESGRAAYVTLAQLNDALAASDRPEELVLALRGITGSSARVEGPPPPGSRPAAPGTGDGLRMGRRE